MQMCSKTYVIGMYTLLKRELESGRSNNIAVSKDSYKES
jgi:hypothetical protein